MLPKIYNIPMFNVDSETCPKVVKIVLRQQIRDLFKLRSELSHIVLSNKGLDSFIDNWWTNHHNIIRAASIRNEWDWSTLSLKFDENVMRPVDLLNASKDYATLLARPCSVLDFKSWTYSATLDVSCFSYDYRREYYLGYFHPILYNLFMSFFKHIILEDRVVNQSTTYSDKDSKLSKEISLAIKTDIESSMDSEHKSKFCKKIQESKLLGVDFIPFNKIPQKIYEQWIAGVLPNNFIDNFSSLFMQPNMLDLFELEIYKAVGAHQLNNDEGPLKTTLVNKLVKQYYNWLTALSLATSGNPVSIGNSFDEQVKSLKERYSMYTESPFKIRNEHTEGFVFVNEGTFEQLFARLQESVKGCLTKQFFVVSFHPCDMITCSLGYNWSSCQSFVNVFTDLPREYGSGSSYSGMYNRGNFEFASGNCFIAYIPYEQRADLPQYLWAKLKRCLLWVGNNLDCMRQNFFYPGKPQDQETLALAKVVREYIQDVCAPFNFSNGTIDWKGATKSVRFCSQVNDEGFEGFNEVYCNNNGSRYDDPILRVAYLKTSKDRSLIYAQEFKSFDTGKTPNSYGSSTNVCPVCGKTLKSTDNYYCSKCSKELISVGSKLYHESDLLRLNVDGKNTYYSIDDLDKLKETVVTEDGTAVNFKDAFKVLMPSGYKFFKKLPDYVKQCKVCKEYFHSSFMVGDVCINHINTVLSSDESISYDSIIESFLQASLSFACNDTTSLTALLSDLSTRAVKWISGKLPNEFIPSSAICKGKFLCCKNNKLVLTSQANTPVIDLSKLLQRKEVE